MCWGSLKLILTPPTNTRINITATITLVYKDVLIHHPSWCWTVIYWGTRGIWKGNKSKYGHYYWHLRLPRVVDVLFPIWLASLKGKQMMSLSKHPTGRVITENSTSFYMRIPVDLSSVCVCGWGGGWLVLIYAFRQANFKFQVMKCHFLFWHAEDPLLSSKEGARWWSEWRLLIIRPLMSGILITGGNQYFLVAEPLGPFRPRRDMNAALIKDVFLCFFRRYSQ